VAVVTSRTEAELIADVLRNNDLRAVVSAEMPADESHSGSLAAPWTQPTGKARQSEILIQQLLAEAGASGISPELVSIDARGDWTIGDQAAVLHDVNGWIVFRFHARDLHLVMGRQHEETACDSGYSSTDNFRVRPTEQMLTKTGYGTPADQRLYQLIRQRDPVQEHVRGHVPRRRRSGACLHLRVNRHRT
jgi:Thioredoxin like C-terminal domain